MKVLYDHQVFTWQDYGGISRYYFELISRLRASAELSLLQSNNEYIRSDSALAAQVAKKNEPKRYSKLEKLFVPKKRRVFVQPLEINQAHTIQRLNEGRFDLFHPTYYSPYFLEHLRGRPFVLTVYDMIHELFPEYFYATDPTSAHKAELVAKASHIIAISQTTKDDLVKVYGVDEAKVTVTYLGSSLNASGEVSSLVLPEKYFLMVGSRATYKNCFFAARALSRLMKRRRDVHIVFAGGGRFSEEEIAYFSELGIVERVHHSPAGDADLRALYGRAQAFIFPSLYEGFGIPTIEAFSCGCPVLSSDTATLREVAADAALYFEPKNVGSIEAAAERILDEPGLREQLRSLGAQRLKLFSWERCAEQTAAVYAMALSR